DRTKGRRVQKLTDFEQRMHRVDIDAFDHGCLARILRGHNQVTDAFRARGDGDGQHALNRTQGSVETELAGEEIVGDILNLQRAVGAEQRDGDGQVESGAFLLDVSGREIDGDPGGRDVEAGVLDGAAHAVTRFAHGGVGQADGGEQFFFEDNAREVDLNIDDRGVNAVDGGAAGCEEHRTCPELGVISGRLRIADDGAEARQRSSAELAFGRERKQWRAGTA